MLLQVPVQNRPTEVWGGVLWFRAIGLLSSISCLSTCNKLLKSIRLKEQTLVHSFKGPEFRTGSRMHSEALSGGPGIWGGRIHSQAHLHQYWQALTHPRLLEWGLHGSLHWTPWVFKTHGNWLPSAKREIQVTQEWEEVPLPTKRNTSILKFNFRSGRPSLLHTIGHTELSWYRGWGLHRIIDTTGWGSL